jgi:hypothetical protein
MTSRLWLLMVADPPRRGDAPEVAEAKADAAARAWCTQLLERGEKVTYAGIIPARTARKKQAS